MSQAFPLRGEAQVLGFQRALDLWRRAGDAEGEVDTLVQIGVSYRQRLKRPRKLSRGTRRRSPGLTKWRIAGARHRLSRVWASPPANWGNGTRRSRPTTERSRSGPAWRSREQGQDPLFVGEFLPDTRRSRAGPPLLRASSAVAAVRGRPQRRSQHPQRDGHGLLGPRPDPEARESFERLLELSQGRRTRSRAGVTSLAGFDQRTGELQKAQELYQKALQIFERLGSRSFQAQVLHNMAALSHDLGDLETALDQYRQALDLCRSVEDRNLTLSSRSSDAGQPGLDSTPAVSGAVEGGAPDSGSGLRVGRNLDNSDSIQALALYYIGQVHIQLHEPRVALPFLERSFSTLARSIPVNIRSPCSPWARSIRRSATGRRLPISSRRPLNRAGGWRTPA